MTTAGTDTASARGEHAHPDGTVRVRVRYSECDPQGVVHHGGYLPWLELGRTELLRARGKSYAQLEAEGIYLVVTKLQVSYRRAAKYDDVLEVRTRIAEAGRLRIRHEYDVVLIERGDADEGRALPADGVVATAWSEIACVDRAGRPRPLPEWLISDGV